MKFSDGRARAYRRRGERFSDSCVLETDRFSGGSVMKWGGRSHVERTDLKVIDGYLNTARYRDEILAPIILPFLRRHKTSINDSSIIFAVFRYFLPMLS